MGPCEAQSSHPQTALRSVRPLLQGSRSACSPPLTSSIVVPADRALNSTTPAQPSAVRPLVLSRTVTSSYSAGSKRPHRCMLLLANSVEFIDRVKTLSAALRITLIILSTSTASKSRCPIINRSKKCHSRADSSPHIIRDSVGALRVHTPNGTSINSAVFAGLTSACSP